MIPLILRGVVNAAAEETTLKTNVVPPGHVFKVKSIFAVDLTSSIATRIEIGSSDGSANVPISAFAGSIAAKIGVTVYNPGWINAGHCIYAIFLTPTAGDNLALYARGELYEHECPLRSRDE